MQSEGNGIGVQTKKICEKKATKFFIAHFLHSWWPCREIMRLNSEKQRLTDQMKKFQEWVLFRF